MIIKEADGKESDIVILEALAARRDAGPEVRKRIELDIRKIRAGIKGEADAAYEIDFHFGPSKNYAVIHDLRIECEGRVAQIDHLVIGRFLDFWVCETKSFSGGIAINDQGECTGFFNNKPYGMASPIEQNKKHIMVLGNLFTSGMVCLPKRLGFSVKPRMRSVVLVSKNARITRPEGKIEGLGGLIKCDQFRSTVERENESDNNPLTMAKLIAGDTLEDFARKIAAQHKPIAFKWAAKFGLPETAPEAPSGQRAKAPPLPRPAVDSTQCDEPHPIPAEGRKKKKLVCASCSEPVELKVARFCWFNKARFGESIYCRDCQKAV